MDCLNTAIGQDIAGRNTAIAPWSNRLVGLLVAMEVLQQPVEQLAERLVEALVEPQAVEVAVGRSEQHHHTWN